MQRSQSKLQPEMEIIEANTAKICDAVKEALTAEDQAKGAVHYLIRTKIIAGQMLEKRREATKHGEWVKWCENVLPISWDTANRWIGLAKFAKAHGAELDDAKSVRHAYVLAGLLPESQSGSGGGSPQSEDAYLTDLLRTDTRLRAHLAKRPLIEWAVDEVRMLRERLKPLVELYVELNATA
jgi:hypothetical protein